MTMKSHGVEISIARCVGEMVRDPNPMSFFYFVYFFFIMCFVLFNYWEQRLHAALAIVKKKPDPLFFSNRAPGKKPLSQVSLVRDQPHTGYAKQEIKLRLKGWNKNHQINTWGEINRKTLAVDINKINN